MSWMSERDIERQIAEEENKPQSERMDERKAAHALNKAVQEMRKADADPGLKDLFLKSIDTEIAATDLLLEQLRLNFVAVRAHKAFLEHQRDNVLAGDAE